MNKTFYVYILATRKDGPLYIGVSNDIVRRISEHKNPKSRTFAWRFNIHTLVFYEPHSEAAAAIAREKQLKRWARAWKVALIEKENPGWMELSADFTA